MTNSPRGAKKEDKDLENPAHEKTRSRSTLHRFKALQVILPGQSATIHIAAPEDETVAIQPWENNKNPSWPEPQLCTVQKGQVELDNKTETPVILKKDIQYIKILPTYSPSKIKGNF